MSKKNKKLKKSQRAKRTLQLKQERKTQTISRLITVAILGIIGFSVYSDLYAEQVESRYLSDAELAELNKMDSELLELEEKYKELPQVITVCWDAKELRFKPSYMGCTNE